jgi:hypothetical protein
VGIQLRAGGWVSRPQMRAGGRACIPHFNMQCRVQCDTYRAFKLSTHIEPTHSVLSQPLVTIMQNTECGAGTGCQLHADCQLNAFCQLISGQVKSASAQAHRSCSYCMTRMTDSATPLDLTCRQWQ